MQDLKVDLTFQHFGIFKISLNPEIGYARFTSQGFTLLWKKRAQTCLPENNKQELRPWFRSSPPSPRALCQRPAKTARRPRAHRRNGATVSFKSSIWKNGSRLWEILTFKGHLQVKISNGSGIWDSHVEIVRVEIMRTDRRIWRAAEVPGRSPA